jgi:hypothetical protein
MKGCISIYQWYVPVNKLSVGYFEKNMWAWPAAAHRPYKKLGLTWRLTYLDSRRGRWVMVVGMLLMWI